MCITQSRRAPLESPFDGQPVPERTTRSQSLSSVFLPSAASYAPEVYPPAAPFPDKYLGAAPSAIRVPAKGGCLRTRTKTPLDCLVPFLPEVLGGATGIRCC